MSISLLKRALVVAVIAGGAMTVAGCAAPADRQSTTRHVSHPRAAERAGKVLMPAHACTLVRHRGGDQENVCAPSQGNPRRYPPYPTVPHARGDQVKHVRYPAEWVASGDAADAEAAREAAASGAWD